MDLYIPRECVVQTEHILWPAKFRLYTEFILAIFYCHTIDHILFLKYLDKVWRLMARKKLQVVS